MRLLVYKDLYHPKIKKDLKNIDKLVKTAFINNHLDNILTNPIKYNELLGSLKGIYSYHFKINNVEYRACYTINEKDKEVYFLMIGKRENIYDILKRRT